MVSNIPNSNDLQGLKWFQITIPIYKVIIICLHTVMVSSISI